MLKTRVWMGTALVVTLAFGLWIDESLAHSSPPWLPPFPCWLSFAVISVIGCCRELRQLLRRSGARTSRVVSYGGILAIVLANWVPWVVHAQDVMSHLAWPFAAMVIANAWVLLREAWIFRAPGSAVTTLGAGMFINFYLGVLATFFIELRWVEHGLMALACHIGAAKCGDIAAYFGGRAFGRHKLSPWLSPNKTVEGAVSGAAGSVLAVLVVVAIGARLMNVETLRFGTAVLFGLAIGIAGQVGDLVESLIKRDCQQKDASDLVPGFGGMLDVLDSPLFSAPLAFLLWIVLGPGWGGGL